MADRNLPWYRWQFSMGGVIVIALFLSLAWSSVTQDAAPPSVRLVGTCLFLYLAMFYAVREWRDRKGVRNWWNRKRKASLSRLGHL